ncbi:hypothetical protein JHK82_025025 [Glycine max]|nr:hypothetical protein JHK85_025641 [Glycine max]KAG5012885.1 hypothetical protein JHK86_025146 [Glycine max]KAG5133837.1 hypothetical protein JHK82_025025 [Glycine max]
MKGSDKDKHKDALEKEEKSKKVDGRRPGDAEIVYASTEKAERELNWNNMRRSRFYSLREMVAEASLT